MKSIIAGYLAIGLAAALAAGAADWHASQNLELLKSEYVAKSQAEAERGSKDVEQALQTIYQNLRTLASLPGVRSIGRHAEALSPEARTTFQLIYNNLASSVSVSEVYISPADFAPDRIDPVTTKPEEPIIMFDELILNAGAEISEDERASNPDAVADAENEGPPETEVYEYRLLKQQAAWFRQHYPDNREISGLRVPIIGGPEVITCDNTYFIDSGADSDRTGLIFSVPFFGADGAFRGMVSAIILNRALADLLPDENYVLTNAQYGYVVARPDAPDHVSASLRGLRIGETNAALMYSVAMPLAINDPQGGWSVWAGYDDARFYSSPDYLAQQRLRLYGYGFAALLLLAGSVSWFFASRGARTSRLAAVHLAKARDEAQAAETEARALADKFQTLNEDITRLNGELNDKVRLLQEVQEDVIRKGKLAQLGQLTATIAHELRNPMGTIRTTAFLIRRKAGEQMPALTPLLARIDGGIGRCDDIITQLLDFARTKTPDFSAIDVDKWLVDTLEEEASSLPDTIEVECNLGLGELTAEFDPARLRRVIINLLANASEAMVGKPGMPVEHGPARPRIQVSTALSARGIEIRVADNGPGMDQSVIEKVREPLYTTKNFGTGLGIPAIERILELHGGGLDIESQLGQGAVFTAWFPQAQRKAAAA